MSYIFLFLISTLLTFTPAGISDSEECGVSTGSESPERERLFEPLYDPGSSPLSRTPSLESLISIAFSEQSSEFECNSGLYKQENFMEKPPAEETIKFFGFGGTELKNTFRAGSNELEQREWLAQVLFDRFCSGEEDPLSFLNRCEISQHAIKCALSDPIPFHVQSRLPRNLQKLLDKGGKVYLNPAHLPNIRDTIKFVPISSTSKQYGINCEMFNKLSREQIRANIDESPFLILGDDKLLGCIFSGFVADLTQFDLAFDPQIAIVVNSLSKMRNGHKSIPPLILSLCIAGKIKNVLHITVAISAQKDYFEGPNAIFASVPDNLKNMVELDGKPYFIENFLQNGKPLEMTHLTLPGVQTAAEILFYNCTEKHFSLQIAKSDATHIIELASGLVDKDPQVYKFHAEMVPSGILAKISRQDVPSTLCDVITYTNIASLDAIAEIFKRIML